jgi:two-component system, NtrC family, response regulator
MNQSRRKVLTMVHDGKLTVDEAEDLLDAIEIPLDRMVPEIPRIELVGESEQMRAYRKRLDRIAATQSPALIQGEPGTGKAAAARYVHYHGNRAGEAFAELDCSQSAVLAESEIFGHEEGAFTGAVRAKKGLLDSVAGGSLLLSDVDALPPETQSKLQTLIRNGTFTRVGGTRQLHADVRLIGVCSGDLKDRVDCGRFSPDLHQSLSVCLARTTPLRERPGDIPVLVEHFVGKQAERDGRRPPRISSEALKALSGHNWPRNESEVANVIERAMMLCEGDEIRSEHLPSLLGA